MIGPDINAKAMTTLNHSGIFIWLEFLTYLSSLSISQRDIIRPPLEEFCEFDIFNLRYFNLFLTCGFENNKYKPV